MNHIAFAIVLDRILTALIPRDVRQVDHAVDVTFQTYKETEFSDVLNFTFNLCALWMGLSKDFPRVALCLLEAKGHAALYAIDFQNHDVDFLRGRNDLARVYVLLCPRHFRDVNQTFNTGFQLNKCTIVGDVGDAALVGRTERVFRANQIPRIFHQLLHAQGDTVGVFVDLDNLNLDRLADCQDFGWVVHTAPCHVCDVQQAVYTAQINERTIFGDVLDHAVDALTFGQVADNFGALLCTGFFEDRAARNNDVATAAVHLQDLERLLETHQRASVAHRADVHLRARQERHSATQIDGETTFDAAKDCAFDAGVVCICFFQAVPGFFAAGHFAADNRFALRVLCRAEVHFDLIANSDFWCFTGICEFFKFDTAFHFVADVDDGLARLDCDNLAFYNRPFLGCVHFEAFVQEGFEFLHGC